MIYRTYNQLLVGTSLNFPVLDVNTQEHMKMAKMNLHF